MINGKLDETDIRILKFLQQDARMDLNRLAEMVHKTPSPVSKRIKLLQEAGYIQHYVAVLNRSMIGKPVLVVVMVLLEKQTKSLLAEFERVAIAMPQVQSCLHISGKWDFALQVTAETPQHYYDFLMDKLCDLPNVAHVESSFVLNESKNFSPFEITLTEV